MPVFASGRVAVIVWPGVPVGEVLVHALGLPAATLERPPGTNIEGSLSVCWSDAWPAAGVATMAPRTVARAPGPTANVSSLGNAANAAADIETETWTVVVAPAATETLEGETPITALRWLPLIDTLK